MPLIIVETDDNVEERGIQRDERADTWDGHDMNRAPHWNYAPGKNPISSCAVLSIVNMLLTPHPLEPSLKPRPVQFRASLHSACRDTAPKPSFDATTPRAPPSSVNARVGHTVPFFPTLRIIV